MEVGGRIIQGNRLRIFPDIIAFSTIGKAAVAHRPFSLHIDLAKGEIPV
jgi:hypothetical protein